MFSARSVGGLHFPRSDDQITSGSYPLQFGQGSFTGHTPHVTGGRISQFSNHLEPSPGSRLDANLSDACKLNTFMRRIAQHGPMGRDGAFDSRDGVSSEMHSPHRVLAADEIYHILQNSRRRAVLRLLLAADEPFRTTSELAAVVAASETEEPTEQVDANREKTVYVSLLQSHLPKLEAHGLIERSEANEAISSTDAAGILDPFLDERLEEDFGQWVQVFRERPELTGTESALVDRFLPFR